MIDQHLIEWIVKKEDLVVPTLFKPVQFNILKKIIKNQKLNENEKRYLRGKMRQKILALHELMQKKIKHDEFTMFLNSIGSYYITGLDALKHNGYGWYYEPKIIEVINTKIEGIIHFKERTVKFIRVKSIKNRRTLVDKETKLKYATNEQIIKDTVFTKNQYTKMVWIQMFKRYGKIFAKTKLFEKIAEPKIDYLKYGV